MKLLQHNASVLAKNNAGDSPFDLAVRFNKRGRVGTVACVSGGVGTSALSQ